MAEVLTDLGAQAGLIGSAYGFGLVQTATEPVQGALDRRKFGDGRRRSLPPTYPEAEVSGDEGDGNPANPDQGESHEGE